MRTLLILGGLVVCLLLVTPSNGDRTESQDRGGEKGTSDLREFIGQNENGKANRIDAGSSSTIDQQVQLRPRRQEPSSSNRPWKKCNGCFSSLSIEDPIKVSKRTRREEKQPEKKNSRKPKLPNMYSLTTRSIRTKRDKKSKPSKKSSLSDKDRSKRRSKSRKRDKKRKSSKKSSLPDTDRLEGKPELDRPATRERKIEQPRPHMFALMSVRPPDFSTHEKPPNDEGRKERKNDRMRRREEKKERKMRKHHPHHPHHHHHPEGEKEEYKGRRTGSRSPITSTYGGIWDDLSDGKGVAERMKRQSDNGKRRKDQKDRWRSGSRSAVASLPTLRF